VKLSDEAVLRKHLATTAQLLKLPPRCHFLPRAPILPPPQP
jgi:hypothetical protein